MASSKKRENGRIQKNIAKVFLAVLVFFLIGNFFMPTKTYSVKDREMLAEKPKLSWNALWTGTYLEEYEAYQKDQFLGKGLLRDLAAPIVRIAGNNAANGAFYGSQRQLFEDIVIPDHDALQKQLDAIGDFAEQNWDVKMSMLLVPDAAEIYTEQLPLATETIDQKSLIQGVKKSIGENVELIDIAQDFEKHANEKIYYQTDYHWTSLGAYYAFQIAAPVLEIPEEGLSNFVSYTVTTNFTGALAAKSGYMEGVDEEISIYVPGSRNIEVVVNYVDEGEKRTSVFDSEKLDGKDKYQVFLGGDYPLVTIRTTADSDRRLLIFKDSAANSFVQFLLPYFREIVLIDTELYDGKASELLRTHQISDVLFLYRGNTFFGKNDLSGVLTGE